VVEVATKKPDFVLKRMAKARVQPNVEKYGTLADLVKEGKIRAIGLSECSAATLRRACAVAPIAALQSEWSLWERDVESEIAPTARELGVTFVPYSPLGRGMLSAKITSRAQLDDDDWRLSNPRFVEDVFDENLRRVQEIVAVANEVGATPAQVSLAWLLAKGADWVPIPGTIRIPHLEEDLAAVDVSLTADQVTRLDNITQPLGDHHGPTQMAMFDR
jgi:aryl-alcohol dehydrogenase-like predicted oxidoreductase